MPKAGDAATHRQNRKGLRKPPPAQSATLLIGVPGNTFQSGIGETTAERRAGPYRYFVTPWNSRIRVLISRGRASEASSMQWWI